MNDYLECTEIEDLNTEDSRRIAKCIGMEAFRRLVAMYSGETIYIKSFRIISANIRRKQAAYDYSCGMKVTEISRKYGITHTSVYRIIKEVKAEPITTSVNAVDLVSYDDLPDDQKDIADCIGFDNLKQLAEIYPSMLITVPVLERVCINARNRAMFNDYLYGLSFGDLSEKYDMHPNSIRHIIKLISRNA